MWITRTPIIRTNLLKFDYYYETVTSFFDKLLCVVKCGSLLNDLEHQFLAPSTNTPELQIFEAFDGFTIWLWVSSIEKETSHAVPPDSVPVLVTADWILAVAINWVMGASVIASSDSEADDDGSEMELLSDVDSIGDDANHNPELASSLMEMELSDSGDFHTDYKGKGKLKILKTPMVNAKRTHTALSPDESPTNARVAVKKLKSATVVPMSEDDILWRNQPQPDDPFRFAPVIVNPWESEYVIRPVDYLF
ncbi:hypothetical protein EDD22DRAFT_851684 [Suillus occidentalis]|nr:hypothetical protein EDD22DRAFT_851684 [Suillus occidentalis]